MNYRYIIILDTFTSFDLKLVEKYMYVCLNFQD